jgi:adenylyltransferase/sulfurtransferase
MSQEPVTPEQPDGAAATTGEAPLDRYVRQIRYAPLGEAGQRRLLAGRVLVCGCGALGSVLANTLARAGVGHLRIVDRDFLELNNLQRQVLYDEDDVAAGIPKAVSTRQMSRSCCAMSMCWSMEPTTSKRVFC